MNAKQEATEIQEQKIKIPSRKGYCIYLNPALYEAFKKLAILLNKRSFSRAVEEALKEYIQKHQKEAQMKITITEPINKKLANSIRLKLIKERLTQIIEMLGKISKKITNQTAINYWEGELREILPDAVRLYEKTADKELEQLLEKAEKLLDLKKQNNKQDTKEAEKEKTRQRIIRRVQENISKWNQLTEEERLELVDLAFYQLSQEHGGWYDIYKEYIKHATREECEKALKDNEEMLENWRLSKNLEELPAKDKEWIRKIKKSIAEFHPEAR